MAPRIGKHPPQYNPKTQASSVSAAADIKNVKPDPTFRMAKTALQAAVQQAPRCTPLRYGRWGR